MKYVLFALLAVIAVFAVIIVICVVRAAKVKAVSSEKKPAVSWTSDEEKKYAERLSEMVKVSTVSKKKGEEDSDFLKLQAVMEKLYPNIFSKLEKHDEGAATLLEYLSVQKGTDLYYTVQLGGGYGAYITSINSLKPDPASEYIAVYTAMS